MLAPHVLGCYRVHPGITATITNVLQGQSLDNVWHTLNKKQGKTIKVQLKEQLRHYRTHTPNPILEKSSSRKRNFFGRLSFELYGPFWV